MSEVELANRVLVDTNILAYLFAPSPTSVGYELRAQLARRLLAYNDVMLVVYEEQLYEVKRTLDDLTIRNKIRIGTKLGAIDTIYRDFVKLVEDLQCAGRAIVAPRTEEVVRRASLFYAALEQRLGSKRLRRMRRISVDLKIIAVAEKLGAAVLTRDRGMYDAYRDALHERANVVSLYYLDVAGNEAHYLVCGGKLDFLERALDEVCATMGLKRGRSLIECKS